MAMLGRCTTRTTRTAETTKAWRTGVAKSHRTTGSVRQAFVCTPPDVSEFRNDEMATAAVMYVTDRCDDMHRAVAVILEADHNMEMLNDRFAIVLVAMIVYLVVSSTTR